MQDLFSTSEATIGIKLAICFFFADIAQHSHNSSGSNIHLLRLRLEIFSKLKNKITLENDYKFFRIMLNFTNQF